MLITLCRRRSAARTVGRRAYAVNKGPAWLQEGPFDEEGPDGINYNPTAAGQPVRRYYWWGWLSAIGGGPYNDDHVSDEFYWAAAELYVTTKKDVYKAFAVRMGLFVAVAVYACLMLRIFERRRRLR